jgi:peptide/nickel transport system ATP-binding protein
MLEVIGLSKAFKKKGGFTEIVKNASFTVGDNETVGIVGPSGCGKSTIARIICGTIRKDSGTIIFDGEKVISDSGRYNTAMRKKIQLIGQQPFLSLDGRQKIGNAIVEPMLRHKIAPRAECYERANGLLEKVWLDKNVMDMYPHQLSGGMCQRVVIARALGLEPKLLIADESTSMLDTSSQAQVIRLLHRLKQDGVSILFISHDMELVEVFSDRVLRMENYNLINIKTEKRGNQNEEKNSLIADGSNGAESPACGLRTTG